MYNSSFGLLGLFDVFVQPRPNLIQSSEFLRTLIPNLKISCQSLKKIRAAFRLVGLSPPKLHPYVIFFPFKNVNNT